MLSDCMQDRWFNVMVIYITELVERDNEFLFSAGCFSLITREHQAK